MTDGGPPQALQTILAKDGQALGGKPCGTRSPGTRECPDTTPHAPLPVPDIETLWEQKKDCLTLASSHQSMRLPLEILTPDFKTEDQGLGVMESQEMCLANEDTCSTISWRLQCQQEQQRY